MSKQVFSGLDARQKKWAAEGEAKQARLAETVAREREAVEQLCADLKAEVKEAKDETARAVTAARLAQNDANKASVRRDHGRYGVLQYELGQGGLMDGGRF